MFKDWLSGELRSWYVQSAHKDRIDFVGGRLLELKYLPVVVRLHLHEWVRFGRHLETQALPLPASVHDPEVQLYLEVRFPRGSPSRRRGIRASIRIFLEMDGDGRFTRRALAPRRATNALFQQAVPAYLDFLRKHHGVAAKTVRKRAFQLTLFTGYLERAGISTWPEVQPAALRTFLVTQLTDQAPGTRRSYASTLRGFLRWAFLQGLLERDLSPAAASVRQYRLAGIPDLLTDAEVTALLQAVDRSTALGKRDYAILLLAARFGMRPGDIRQLRLDHIHWRDQQIALPQAKTGRLLVLPLLPEVADALIAYLRHGRPQAECRNVFVRHLAPYEPFVPDNNLATIVQGAFRRAGLEPRDGRQGIYLFRHSSSALRASFHDVLARAAIVPAGAGRRPRLHDLRGTFAVHRLLRWYEQDADLNAKLPLLVTYLGHVGLQSSQRYLQLAKDLLGEVTRRHEARFGHLITDGQEGSPHEIT